MPAVLASGYGHSTIGRRAPARRTALGTLARLSIIGLSRLPVIEDFH
jgi:hypothetical protein